MISEHLSYHSLHFAGGSDVYRSQNLNIHLNCGATSSYCCLSYARNTGKLCKITPMRHGFAELSLYRTIFHIICEEDNIEYED